MIYIMDKEDEFLKHISYSISQYYTAFIGKDWLLITMPGFNIQEKIDSLLMTGVVPYKDENISEELTWVKDRLFKYEKDGVNYYVWIVNDTSFIRDAYKLFKLPTVYDFIRFYVTLYHKIYLPGGNIRYMTDVENKNLYTNSDIDNEPDVDKRIEMIVHRNECINESYQGLLDSLAKSIGQTALEEYIDGVQS